MSLLGSLASAGARTVTLPLRGTVVVVEAGLEVERRTRQAAIETTGRMALDALDVVLADDTVDRVLERIEASGVAQHVAQRVLQDGIAEQIVMRVFEGPELERMIAAALDSERTQDSLARVLESEGAERLLERVLSSPASERMLAQVLKSPLLQETVTRLLESEELWVLVDEIARSPPVTEAITLQSIGFVDQVAGRVRDSSRDADAWVERAARRLGRRSRRAPEADRPVDPASNGRAGRDDDRTEAAAPPSGEPE
ncbi:MAG: hypothetical protein ACHQDY_10500 [Solirubrobacterales bacterium]